LLQAEQNNPQSAIPNPQFTAPGKTIGTPGYMSPEQAAGLLVDARTDLFSLGVVLHEMISGHAPFVGATSLEAIQAILETEPPPLPPELPAEIAQIVRRALCKNRDERYQTARALLADLTRFQPQLTTAAPPAPTPLTANRRWLRPVAIGLLVVLALGVGAWRLLPVLNRRPPPEPEISLTKLVDGAGIGEAAISLDGQYVAYTQHEVKEPSLLVKHLLTQNTVVLVPPSPKMEYHAPTFAPDSHTLYFLRYDANRDVKELYRVPVTGGTPQRVLERIDSPVAVAPDGQQLAFIRFDRARKESVLLVTQLDGSGERQLVTRQEPNKLFVGRPAWAPDGMTIAYAAGTSRNANDYQLYEIPTAGGTERQLTADHWTFVFELAWLKDRSGLILLADNPQTFVWHLALPDGRKRRLTGEPVSELDGIHSLSMTADETALVTVREESIHEIQVLSGKNLSQTILLDSGKQEGHDGLGWTPDGRVVYASKKDGPPTIASIDADGKNLRRLPTVGLEADAPSASADGRYIVYSAVNPQPSGKTTRNIWRMNADGSQPQQLTFGNDEIDSRCSPDNRWVVYAVHQDNGRRSLWKVPLEGGQSVQLTPETAANPSATFAPDGKLLAYYHRGAEDKHKRIHIVSMETGQHVQTLAIPHTAYLLQWLNAGRALCYAEIRQGVTNLWRLPLNGRPAQQMTQFKSDVITHFAWSPDGTRLVCARRSQNDNVLLLRDFK
jgi:Tol biopolymer transport system component